MPDAMPDENDKTANAAGTNSANDANDANDANNANDANTEELILALRRKQGNWVSWGQACQALQKAGYSPQSIFEETGFEPIQQNQVMVGSQVFDSIVAHGISDKARSHFEHKGSDILYELRILSQAERAQAAEFIVEKGLDLDEAHELAKALKDFSWRSELPPGFTNNAGDAFAYRYWKLARQHEDLQTRSRLIAQGLRFAQSDSARQEIEKLLMDFTVIKQQQAPRFPIYRLEEAEQLPRIVPVVGEWPLQLADYKAVPLTEEEGRFRLVKFSGTGAWVPLPGWQVVLNAEDPVAIMIQSDQLPSSLPGKVETVLLLIDRAQRQWNLDSYFITEQDGQIQLRWFGAEPQTTLLGQLILLLRPKKVLDESYTTELWQVDE